MNDIVVKNYSRLQYSLFYIPLIVLLSIVVFLIARHSLNTEGYIAIQKDCFLFLNHNLGQYPRLMHNLTQIGDALIVLSLLSVFFVYAPAMWDSLITASIISMVASPILKNIFTIPRPAAALDEKQIIIIGQKLQGFNSLPSGHSITFFTAFTVLLFAFLPNNWMQRLIWILFIVTIGLSLALTRVGVGAHFPLDVLTGCTIGFICGLSGIFITRKYPLFAWLKRKKYIPLFVLLLLTSGYLVCAEIIKEPLLVYFIALAALFFSLVKTIHVYIKK